MSVEGKVSFYLLGNIKKDYIREAIDGRSRCTWCLQTHCVAGPPHLPPLYLNQMVVKLQNWGRCSNAKKETITATYICIGTYEFSSGWTFWPSGICLTVEPLLSSHLHLYEKAIMGYLSSVTLTGEQGPRVFKWLVLQNQKAFWVGPFSKSSQKVQEEDNFLTKRAETDPWFLSHPVKMPSAR